MSDYSSSTDDEVEWETLHLAPAAKEAAIAHLWADKDGYSACYLTPNKRPQNIHPLEPDVAVFWLEDLFAGLPDHWRPEWLLKLLNPLHGQPPIRHDEPAPQTTEFGISQATGSLDSARHGHP